MCLFDTGTILFVPKVLPSFVGLPAPLADLVRADDALRQQCLHYAAGEIKRRAQVAAEASKAKLYIKRKNRKIPGLKDRNTSELGPSIAHQKQWRKPLSLQQKQNVANDIFKQLVGGG